MFKTYLLLLLLLLSPLSAQVHATVISGTHTTTGSRSVDLQGLEWLSFDITSGQSRQAVEDGFGGLFDNGWRYATGTELSIFLTSLWGGTTQTWSLDNYDGAEWLWRNFSPFDYAANVATIGLSMANFHILFGESTDTPVGVSQYAHWRVFNEYYSGNTRKGWFSDDFGLDGSSNGTLSVTLSAIGVSSVLVRNTSIPEPSILVLFSIGLIGFGFTFKYKKRMSQ